MTNVTIRDCVTLAKLAYAKEVDVPRERDILTLDDQVYIVREIRWRAIPFNEDDAPLVKLDADVLVQHMGTAP